MLAYSDSVVIWHSLLLHGIVPFSALVMLVR